MPIKTLISTKVIYLIGLVAVFLAPIATAMMAVGALIVMDLLFGLMAARKRGEKINSRRLSDTAIKALVYQLLIISSYVGMTYLFPFFPLVKITLAFLGGVEILSIAESFTTITGLPFVSFLKKAIKGYFKNSDIRGEKAKKEQER